MAKNRVNLHELCLELRGWKKKTGIIRQEVVAELMTTGHNLPHEILVPRGADADEEERGPRPVAAQKIDKARGGRRVWTVVQSQSNHPSARPHGPQNLSCEVTCQVPCNQMRPSHTESKNRRCRKHREQLHAPTEADTTKTSRRPPATVADRG
jgi:hypothetical protein